MHKFTLCLTLLLVSSCSVSQKENTTENTELKQSSESTKRLKSTSWIVNFIDKTDYYLTLNKPYFAILPVREYQGKYYFVDENHYIIEYLELSKIYADQGFSVPIPSNIKMYYIKKNSSLKLNLNPVITHFVVFFMDPMWTSVMINRQGMVIPLYPPKDPEFMIDYMQKIEYNNQNFIIEGHYWYEFFKLKANSYLTTDR